MICRILYSTRSRALRQDHRDSHPKGHVQFVRQRDRREPVDGQPIGSHPMVSRLLKGVFIERPPQPRHSTTSNASVVTNHIESTGDNQDLTLADLTLADLTLKLVVLLALTRPSRSVDLTNLDIRFRHFCPESVTFHAAKLAKQSCCKIVYYQMKMIEEVE